MKEDMCDSGMTVDEEEALLKKSKTKNEEGRFYCNWCGEMKPIDELVEIVDNKEHVTWSGCRDCHKRKVRLIQHAPK